MRRRALLAAAVASLAACATPPPPAATRRLTGADIFRLDPAVLRAAVLVDDRVLIQAVVIELRPLAQEERFVIRLQQAAAADPRLPAPPPGRSWRMLALSPEAAATLVTVRQMLASRSAQPDSVAVSVSAQPAIVPADLVAALPIRIALLVDASEGWFALEESTLDLRS